MNAVISEVRGALVSTAILAVVCCGAYPLAVTGVSQVLFRDKADGSLIRDAAGNVTGSALIAQPFSGAGYFHPRPSSAGTNGYDASSSSGSNLGPTSQKLADAIKANVAAYRSENGLSDDHEVPADAVTGSSSGLDPHISLENTALQLARVAKARGLSVEAVQGLIDKNTDRPDLGIFGDAGVNVLRLNVDLDALQPAKP